MKHFILSVATVFVVSTGLFSCANTPEETANCKTLDFLGEGKKKLDTFKQILERIKEERKNAK